MNPTPLHETFTDVDESRVPRPCSSVVRHVTFILRNVISVSKMILAFITSISISSGPRGLNFRTDSFCSDSFVERLRCEAPLRALLRARNKITSKNAEPS